MMKSTEDNWCIKFVFSLNVFYIFKKISSSFTISSPEFFFIQGYVTSSKKYVDFASNTVTCLSYYSYTFQSSFIPPYVYAYHPISTTRICQERKILNFRFC